MTRSPLTTHNFDSPQKNIPNRWRSPDHVALHHWAGTSWDNVVGMMVHRWRVVSSNVIIKDDRIGSMMEEEDRSWSLASADWDGRSLTSECGNSSTGGSWPLSPETHESTARWVADVCGRYGIPITRERVLGHREIYIRHGASYATACPGGLDIDWIVARAREISNLGPAPAVMVPAAPSGPPTGTFNGYSIRDIQSRLTLHGFLTAVDGIYGPNTRSRVRDFQTSQALTVDGVVGPITWDRLLQAPVVSTGAVYDTRYNGFSVRAIQTLLNARGFGTAIDGSYGPNTTTRVREFQSSQRIRSDGVVGPVTWSRLNTPVVIAAAPAVRPPVASGLAVDGEWGPATTRALQAALGVGVDGQMGPGTAHALQSKVGVRADGQIGPITRKALQRHLGVTQDGAWGPNTVRALQTRLNARTF